MKQHYPAHFCYKLALLAPNCSMWSVNINLFTSTLILNETHKSVNNPNLLEYKMGHITVPHKTKGLSRRLPKLFCYPNLIDANANSHLFARVRLPLVIVEGYCGNPMTIKDKDDEVNISKRYDVHLDTDMTDISPYLLCDWFLPTKIVKTFPVRKDI